MLVADEGLGEMPCSRAQPDILSVVAVLGHRSETWLYRQFHAPRRHRIHAFARRHINRREYPYPWVTTWDTLVRRVLRKGSRRLGLHGIVGLTNSRGPVLLRRLLENPGFRLVQAHFGFVAQELGRFVENDERPYVVWLYGSDVFRAGSCRDDFLPRLFTSRARICCTSRALREECIRLGCSPGKVTVIYPGMEIGKPPERRPARGVLRIVSVGRLVDCKDPVALVRIAEGLRDKGVAFLWSHLGGGPLRDEMKQSIASAGVGSCFTVEGEVTNVAVLRRMADADLMVHRAVVAPDGGRESFGVVLVEAASRGIPVVSNRVGGIPEIILDGKSGFLLAPEDVDGMIGRALQLASDPDLRRSMGEAAYQHALENFNTETQSEKLDAYYDEILRVSS